MWQIGGERIKRALQTLRFNLALLQIPREEWDNILILLSAQRNRHRYTVERQLRILLEPSPAQAFKKAFCTIRKRAYTL